jgi:methyl-accepting chemotaxis protein
MAIVDFSLARFSHQVWKIRLRTFLSGMEAISESEASSHTECDLGKWLYSEGLKKYSMISEMQELERLHADFHRSVKGVVAAKNAGDAAKAKQEFEKVVPLSEQVIALLTTVENKVKTTA